MKDILEFTGKWGFLSNFYPCPVKFEGLVYASTENAYQAAKTLDYEDRLLFTDCPPGTAKRWGRPGGRIKIREDWEERKLGIMKLLLQKKFAEYPFRLALLSTEHVLLEEGNWWGDQIWGTVNRVGKNYLGKLLMEVRAEIQEEEEESKRWGSEKKGKGKDREGSGASGHSRQKTKTAKA